MDARPILFALARAIEEQGLDAILIGNAAAALHGAPVTTVDFDFLFRKTPHNIAKLKAVAKALDAVIFRPFYPAPGFFRMVRDEDGLQVDFVTAFDGVNSFAALRAQSLPINFGEYKLLVADLAAVLTHKKTDGRARDMPALGIRKRHSMKRKPAKKKTAPKFTRAETLAALKAESDRALIDMIRRLLAKPANQRTHFLRKKIGYRASCL